MAKCKDCRDCILVNKDKQQYGCYNSVPFEFVNINKPRQCFYFRRRLRNES